MRPKNPGLLSLGFYVDKMINYWFLFYESFYKRKYDWLIDYIY